MSALPTPRITKTPHSAGQYVLQWLGVPVNERAQMLFTTKYFATRQAALQFANGRIFDYMGVF